MCAFCFASRHRTGGHPVASRILQLTAEKAKLGDEVDRIYAAMDAAGRVAPDETEDARLTEIEASQARLTREIEREERRRDDELKAAALPDQSGVKVGATLETEKPWGYQYRQAGAPVKIIRAASLGEKMLAIRAAALGQGRDVRLAADMQAAALGANEAIDSDGGYLVEEDTATDIALTVTGGEVMSRLQEIPLGAAFNSLELKMVNETDRATGSRSGAVRGYWLDEAGAITASRPKFREVALKLKKLGALGYATEELEMDAVAFGSTMIDAFGQELKFLAEDSVINGDGAGKPLGVVGHAATVSVAKETGQAAATVVKANIDKMWARMWAPARAGAVWFINQDIEPQLDNLSITIGVGGMPVYLPPGGIGDTPFARLKGRPVIPIEYCAALGTVGDIILCNLTPYYAWITKGGVKQSSSIHVAFLTGENVYRCVMRVDGKPKWIAPLTPFKGTSDTLSPVVTLATRA
jgi:HK97 family phage major capsid protein